MIAWFRAHSGAILATAVAMGNAGLLGKVGSALLVALASGLGNSQLP
jgi:ABC-type taurine transport system substrate-binding protein